MRKFLAKYLLFIYINFIKNDDVNLYKKWSQPIIKITLFIRSIYIWFGSILLFPIFVIGMEINEKMKKFKNRRKLINFRNIYF